MYMYRKSRKREWQRDNGRLTNTYRRWPYHVFYDPYLHIGIIKPQSMTNKRHADEAANIINKAQSW